MIGINNSYQNSTNINIIIITILLILAVLLCPASCFNQPQTAIPPMDQFFEEKNRLGSMPPSCHNKCNQCHPCMAVQVPNLHGHERAGRASPDMTRIASTEGLFLQANNNRYSNYKPLSWKCHCGGHFFNP